MRFECGVEKEGQIFCSLINENHESFFLVAKKNRAAAARRSEAADLHFDNGLTHTARLVIPFPPRSELLSTGDQEPNQFSFVPLPCQKFDPLEFQATVQTARGFDGRTYTLE